MSFPCRSSLYADVTMIGMLAVRKVRYSKNRLIYASFYHLLCCVILNEHILLRKTETRLHLTLRGEVDNGKPKEINESNTKIDRVGTRKYKDIFVTLALFCCHRDIC